MKTLRPYQQEAVDKIKLRLKEVKHPLLATMSVGAGKSLCIAELLLWAENKGYRCLCLTMNSTLIKQNLETHTLQGGNAGVYCHSLGRKETEQSTIFASPKSLINDIPDIPFNIIIIDECHNIHYGNKKTMYMLLLNHYGLRAQTERYPFRVVGLTGTPYRGKGISIFGDEQYFKEEVVNIGTSWLIKQGFLTPVSFGIHDNDMSYDFSGLKLNSLGKFRGTELQQAIDKDERITARIMREIVETGKRAFIFAATRKHCFECAKSLPEGTWAIITGETKHAEREVILERATRGDLYYLISVNCLSVGVDVPLFDLVAWLRPTESLGLYIQGIGRGLRLHPDKSVATVLDYAGNLERHGHVDDPIINQALKPNPDNEKDYCIPCYTCGAKNTIHARRCIGSVDDKRCDYFFDFKACPNCKEKNDITSRECRACQFEIINPNKKLTHKTQLKEFRVKKATYQIRPGAFEAIYYVDGSVGVIKEFYYLLSPKVKNIFYGNFVKQHVLNANKYYKSIGHYKKMKELIEECDTPERLVCKVSAGGKWVINKKIFKCVDAYFIP